MLTKTQRDALIDDLASLDYSYGVLDNPDIPINRVLERFDAEEVQIVVEFYPGRGDYRSISDTIGWTMKGEWFLYGFCQYELVTISVFCTEFVNDYNVPGRDLTSFIMNKIVQHILSTWDELLRQYHAARASKFDIPVPDRTVYDNRLGKKIYKYSVDIYLKTQFNWDKVPEGYEEGTNVVKSISYKTNNDVKFKIISDY